ncbi:MAG TPA: translocation/assembly module TamB domain-containing protein, partial [Salinimicrobium sp.]|nr:translocation/assembly module TamB domain-containing protein [Salinimicrobium sp.]
AVVTTSSLDADVDIFSQLGTADVSMMIGNFNDSNLATYQGNLKVQDFNIGKLLEIPDLGKTTFNVQLDGKGFTAESLNTDVQGTISSLRYNGYTYNGIRIKGILKAPLFNGNLYSTDPNLNLEFNGLADFSKEINNYDFEANVAYADLAALNFIDRDSVAIFEGDIFMNMTGTNLNDMAGEILFLNTAYENNHDNYVFDDLKITSTFEGPVRTIEVISPDLINGTVEGVFDITEIGTLFENAIGSLYTNYQPSTLTTDQYLEFNFDIYNKIVEVFFPKINLAPNTFIRGRVESDASEFRLTFKSPEIKAFDYMLQQVNVQVDNTNPLFNTYIEIDSVASNYYNLSEFNLINVTLNDTLFVRSEFRGGKENDDQFNLNLYHTINPDNNSVVGIQKSDIQFKESVWYLNEFNNKSNRLVFSDGFKDIRIDSLVLSHQEEEIRLSGQMRDSTYKNFKMEFDEVDIGKITPDIDSLDMSGIVNGNLNLLQQDGVYYPNSSLQIDALAINDIQLGDLVLVVEGNQDLSRYNVNTTLTRDGITSLSAVGEIIVNEENPVIDLDVDLRDLNLAAFSPLGGAAIDNIRGFVSGSADVTGNYKNPDISGSLRLRDAGLRIPYLNVDYDFEDEAVVNLSEQQFIFDEITVTDTEFETTGVLDGIISHQNFKKWYLGLNVSTDRLLVLNTEKDEESLYYGTAFISGSAAIYGPTDELVIDVIATTEAGTVFKIPINDAESIGDNSFIHFLSPEEKAARLAGEEIAVEEVKGLELNFDLDVTSDAEVEINMDGS